MENGSPSEAAIGRIEVEYREKVVALLPLKLVRPTKEDICHSDKVRNHSVKH